MKKNKELAYSRALVLKKGALYKKIAICILVLMIIAIVIMAVH